MLSVYSMEKPNRYCNLENRCTSSYFSRIVANVFSNWLSQGTKLKTHLLAYNVGRDQGKGGVWESGRPASRSSGFNSSTTTFRSSWTKLFSVTYWATLLLIALIISGVLRLT